MDAGHFSDVGSGYAGRLLIEPYGKAVDCQGNTKLAPGQLGADQHLDRILSPTLFGTPTNRRIFRGMVYVTDTESWQRIFQLVSENSRWDLSDADVARYLSRSFDYIVDLLCHWDQSEAYRYDPSGELSLREAKKVRRQARRQGGDMRAALEADRMFGMPATPLRHAADLPSPLFIPRELRAAG